VRHHRTSVRRASRVRSASRVARACADESSRMDNPRMGPPGKRSDTRVCRPTAAAATAAARRDVGWS
jgi:hypothetical protein